MTTETATQVQNIWHKIIGGIFASVMAPVLVAFGIKFSDKVLTPPTPAATTTPAATAPATTAPATTGTATAAPATDGTTAPAVTATPATPAAVAPAVATPGVPAVAANSTAPTTGSAGGSGLASAATTPAAGGAPASPQVPLPTFKKPLSQAQRLFNGRDLTGFYTYLGRPRPKAKPYGKNYDPDRVFTVEDGLLRVSGQVPGVLETEKEYSDYWLTVEYKWGDNSAASDAEGGRRSAILLNIDGPDGAIHSATPCAFFVHMTEASTGDLFVASGTGEQHYSLTAAVEQRQSSKQMTSFYTPGAPRTTFAGGLIKRYPPTTAHDLKGPHPTGDLERPHGEWNHLDCVSLNGKIWIRLNDHVVNFATDVTPSAGRIGIQSHGAEIFFREITLQPYLKHHNHGEQASNAEPQSN